MVAIIGGGITGLAASYELTRRGVPFRLLEASERAGGLIRTERVEGFTIEAGPDSVLVQKRAAIELCDELGLASQLIATMPPRTAYVLRQGRLYPLPSPSVLGIPTTARGIASYRLLSPAARVRLALERVAPARAADDESVATFFRRRFGRQTVDLLAEPLLGGIHAGDVEALSVRSLFPRLVEAEARHGSVLRAFRPRPDAAARDGLFRSLAPGMGELVEALVRRLPEGTMTCSAPATALERGGGAWRVTAGDRRVDAQAVILALPAHAAARLLKPLDQTVAALCAEVPYASTASVALGWPRAAVHHPLQGSGFVVARRASDLRITACTWVSSKWPGRAPDGHVLLRAFVGGIHDPRAVDLSDGELVATVVADLSRVLGITGAPALARVHRWRNASPQHNVGQLARVSGIEARLLAHPGLLVAGSGFRSVGIPDCIADGRAAGAAAAAFVSHSAGKIP